jgi:hypothetical protein
MRKPGFFRPKLRRRGRSDASDPDGAWWGSYWRRDPGGPVSGGGNLVRGPAGQGSGIDPPTSLAATPVYCWGLQSFVTTVVSTPWGGRALASMQGGTMADQLFALPQPLPAGRITRLLNACVGNSQAGAKIRLGVYRNRGGDGNFGSALTENLYPSSLLYDTGEVAFATLGPHGRPGDTIGQEFDGLDVEQGLYWAVMTCNSTAASGGSSGVAVDNKTIWPLGGATVTFGNGEPDYNSSLLIGWKHAHTFGALPDPFPTSAPRRLVQATSAVLDVPAIFFGFDPEETR